jgi:flagellar biosynthesis chaperone FliJ
MDSREYHNEIMDLAKEVIQAVIDEGADYYDRLHEVIDSHKWIIYNRFHMEVIAHTNNEEAYQEVYGAEDFGRLVIDRGVSVLFQTIAFFAMEADVRDELRDLAEKAIEEQQAKIDELREEITRLEEKVEAVEDYKQEIEDLEDKKTEEGFCEDDLCRLKFLEGEVAEVEGAEREIERLENDISELEEIINRLEGV